MPRFIPLYAPTASVPRKKGSTPPVKYLSRQDLGGCVELLADRVQCFGGDNTVDGGYKVVNAASTLYSRARFNLVKAEIKPFHKEDDFQCGRSDLAVCLGTHTYLFELVPARRSVFVFQDMK